ncbi:excinuclease ABC subunit UvrC [Hyphomonas pacifica]|uniref:UvrABC system protein C n=1 Tax=Hyphomonas pacifica TaxID=1280941 RepID=A0A062U3W9_9PROT|nr:excinuclease ABC subunit UvrC [Hyphomonas pacifica]KCZ52443.1 excinuclease ABC subunit C [Hyphomonas pacifica]RAN35216.1 excinuclease ABC subunit C [Hyphomonas pacifica]RAN37311.1 excinuclease ABC subunit C [Hyphomonas pacifica]
MSPTDSSASPLRGIDVIKDNLKRLPARPGVYRMFGEHDEVLYVGKARDLKARVSNYARLGGHTQRIARMISMTRRMEFVVTETETEALLLEASLIKSLKPRFNVLLRDDKSFPYILIRRDHEAPQIKKYRGSKMDQGDYFGPFASAGAVMRTLDTLQKAFLLRTCEDSVYSVRTRPCMLHQIKRCAAPCVGLISTEDYQALADQAADFLRGKGADLQKRLAADMEQAAEEMEFERAARLRDRIRALAHVRSTQDVNPEDIEEADVFAIEMDGGVSCVQVFFIRAGQNWGATAHYPRHEREQTPEEVLSAFLVQFYDKRPPPRLILVNQMPDQAELISEALELKAGRKVEVRKPERGSKKDLVAQAARNASEALSRKLAETASQARLLAEVAKVFELEAPPERIEIYDNSHIQGTNAVGGMVVAGPEGFMKNAYRKFNIKDETIEPGDDYGMMREVMRRRFSRALKERDEGNGANWPDLVLIDGGLGQMNAVIEALADIGVTPDDVNLVSIAKGVDRNAGREQFFRPGRPPFKLPETAPVLYYLQRLRDEAHRWAIGAHRAKRSAAIKTSPLDEIEGVGPARKKALLHHFGSAKGVSRAKVADLMEVEGVSEALAERIWGHFNSG